MIIYGVLLVNNTDFILSILIQNMYIQIENNLILYLATIK